jgi:hypothetical protein
MRRLFPAGSLNFLAAVILFVAGTHIVWSAGVAAVALILYDHRAFDIRRQEGTEADALLAAWVRTRPAEQIAFIGSSFTYGYPWQEDVIFSRYFRAINASVIGADLSRMHCALTGSFKAVVLEIPVINEVDSIYRGDDVFECPPPTSTFGHMLSRPYGIAWASMLWDSEAYPKPDQTIQIQPVPKGYFHSREEFRPHAAEYKRRIEKIIRQAQRLGQVFVIPTPVFAPAVTQTGNDADAVRQQIELAIAACREVPEAVCLDPSPFYAERGFYYNLTHLNQAGHKAFAHWLKEAAPALDRFSH